MLHLTRQRGPGHNPAGGGVGVSECQPFSSLTPSMKGGCP